MKSVIGFIIIFFGACLFGSSVIAVFYMFYIECTCFVAGVPQSFFSVPVFLYGFAQALPIILLLSPMFLSLYRIRHPSGFIFPLTVFICLNILIWSILLPFSIRLLESIPENPVAGQHILSPGYFRTKDNTVYYFTSVSDKNTAAGLGINLNEIDKPKNDIFAFNDMLLQKDAGSTFTEPLVRDTLAVPSLLKKIFSLFTILLSEAVIYLGKGLAGWALFASLGLTLATVYGFVNFFSWRLLNGFQVVFMTIGIFLLNSLYYGTGLFWGLDTWLNGYTVKMFSFPIPSIAAINVICCVLFLITGIISAIRHKAWGTRE
jgi:hypothetical protein